MTNKLICSVQLQFFAIQLGAQCENLLQSFTGDWESTGSTVQPSERVMKVIVFGVLWTAWL
jgi:hypothetical protein